MNGLRFSPLEEMELSRELEKLFLLQDRPLSEDKKTFFVIELSNSGLPFRSIMSAIKKLSDDDLRTIKISSILSMARGSGLIIKPEGCSLCEKSGFVRMENPEKYIFSYPCTCQLGSWYAMNQKVVQWNGKKTMMSRLAGLMTFIGDINEPTETLGKVVVDTSFSASGNQSEQELEIAWEE